MDQILRLRLVNLRGAVVDVIEQTEAEGVVREYTARLLGRPIVPGHKHYDLCMRRVVAVLTYHQEQFAQVGGGATTRQVIERLRRGELAGGTCRGCDLLIDLFQLLLVELGYDEAARRLGPTQRYQPHHGALLAHGS